jgi:hypothetical protein
MAVTEEDAFRTQPPGQRFHGHRTLLATKQLEGPAFDDNVKRTRAKNRIKDAAGHVLHAASRTTRFRTKKVLELSGL